MTYLLQSHLLQFLLLNYYINKYISNSYEACMDEEYIEYIAVPNDACDMEPVTCIADFQHILGVERLGGDAKYLTSGCKEVSH